MVITDSKTGFLRLRQDFMQFSYQLISHVLKRDHYRRQHTERFQQLTEREVEVLQLLAGGLNNPKIAEALLISRNTVETHRKNLKRKLKIRSYIQAGKTPSPLTWDNFDAIQPKLRILTTQD